MYRSPHGTIQGINQAEIAERYYVTPSCISYYIRTWTEETDHPFPKPTCRIQQWITRSDGVEMWGKRFSNYDPRDIAVWFEGLGEASTQRRSEGQRNRQRPAVGMLITGKNTVDPAVEELKRRVAKLEETVIF
jgi:hypothetical protein